MDHYVARTTARSQQTDIDADPNRLYNLWDPVDGKDGHDFGADGIFDELEGGMLQRRALAGLPQQLGTVILSTGDRIAEVVGSRA